MKAISEGEMQFTSIFIEEMDFCLDCQACETACPAGVTYGHLVESARAEIFRNGKLNPIRKWLQRIVFRKLLPNRRNLLFFGRAIRFYERTGLRWLVERLLHVFLPSLGSVSQMLPSASREYSSNFLQQRIQPLGKSYYQVGFLTGCMMDLFYSQENVDTIELLKAVGCEVVIPQAQTCCGSLQKHYGDLETARELARQNIRAFDGLELDAIVMNSAGCGAFMKEYGKLLADSPDEEKARRLSGKIKDISEFLTEVRLPERKANSTMSGKRVTYHDPCHLVHTQKIHSQPRELIRSVPDIEYVELPESTWCCGSAGIYNVIQHEDSKKLLERKLANISKTKADILVTGNPGCMAQLAYGLRSAGSNVRLLHLATFLREAYGI